MHALVWSGMQPRHGSEPCGLNVHWHRLEERAYLHFVWRKYLDVYFTSDDGHHLQFHIYRWHSPSRSETMGLIKSLCRVKILYRNATLGPVQFGLYQRRELLPDSSLRWQECCRSLSPSLSLSRPLWLHIDVISIFTFMFYATTGLDEARTAEFAWFQFTPLHMIYFWTHSSTSSLSCATALFVGSWSGLQRLLQFGIFDNKYLLWWTDAGSFINHRG